MVRLVKSLGSGLTSFLPMRSLGKSTKEGRRLGTARLSARPSPRRERSTELTPRARSNAHAEGSRRSLGVPRSSCVRRSEHPQMRTALSERSPHLLRFCTMRGGNTIPYDANSDTNWNLSTSTSPRSVSFSDGMTGNARKLRAIKGSCKGDPSCLAAAKTSSIWRRTVSMG